MSAPKPTVQTLLASLPLQDCARCLIAGVPARESAYAGQSMEARSTAPLRRYCFANIAVLLCAQAGDAGTKSSGEPAKAKATRRR